MVKVLTKQFPIGSFKGQNSDGLYLDGYLKANLEALKENVTKKDYDGFIILSGREGFGKSTLAGQIAMFLDSTYNLKRCVFTAEQFTEACEEAEKFQAVVFDETMGFLSSRGAMSKFNRGLIKIMSEMRSKNLFVILCIPNFFELDRYPAMWRATGLIHINKRGFFGSYDYKKKKLLYLKGKKFYSMGAVAPNFIGRFVGSFVLPKEEYENKKQEAINKWGKESDKEKKLMNQRNLLINHCVENKYITKHNIANLLEISPTQVGRIVT